MGSLATALPEEIKRVRQLQDQYKSLRGQPGVIVEPQIAMMEAVIDAAVVASCSGDVIEMLRVYAALKEWEG